MYNQAGKANDSRPFVLIQSGIPARNFYSLLLLLRSLLRTLRQGKLQLKRGPVTMGGDALPTCNHPDERATLNSPAGSYLASL